MPATQAADFTASDARAIFETAIANATSAEQADNARLLCEYFCDPAFRKAMQNEVARINGA